MKGNTLAGNTQLQATTQWRREMGGELSALSGRLLPTEEKKEQEKRELGEREREKTFEFFSSFVLIPFPSPSHCTLMFSFVFVGLQNFIHFPLAATGHGVIASNSRRFFL